MDILGTDMIENARTGLGIHSKTRHVCVDCASKVMDREGWNADLVHIPLQCLVGGARQYRVSVREAAREQELPPALQPGFDDGHCRIREEN